MTYVDKIRRYNTKDTTLEAAVKRAIDECIKENVLREFLLKNREAVMFTSLYEYDEEKHIKNEKKISYEDGVSDSVEKLASHYISQNPGLSIDEARKMAEAILR